MISELMPRGYDNMFFALFGITNRAVSAHLFSMFIPADLSVFDHWPQCHTGNYQQHPQ